MSAPMVSSIRSRIVWRWRVVDIVVAAVIGVAAGVVYWAWNLLYALPSDALGAVLPGLQPLAGYGIWLIAGVLAALVVRKPGAALFAEVVAATVSALVGAQWGPITIVYGVVEGLGAELVFALALYLSWRLWLAMLAGALAGIGGAILDIVLYYPGSTAAFTVAYVVTFAISGAVFAGLVGWLIVRALASTGALSRFASGRQQTVDV